MGRIGFDFCHVNQLSICLGRYIDLRARQGLHGQIFVSRSCADWKCQRTLAVPPLFREHLDAKQIHDSLD